MAASVNPSAPGHLPPFITAPGETDVLLVVSGIVLLVATVGLGILFLRLHSLPERIAHKTHKLQFEIVAVLGLLSLFTQIHAFWILGLLLALIDIPNFGGTFGRMAVALERIAGIGQGKGGAEEKDEAPEPRETPVAVTENAKPPSSAPVLTPVTTGS